LSRVRREGVGRDEAQQVQRRPDHCDLDRAWSLDFVSDTLTCSRRFRILRVVDDYTWECLALVADTSLSGVGVGRELTRLIGIRGKPHTVVSDNGTELTSSAMLRWSQERRVKWHYIVLGKPASSRALMVACATNASTRRCSRRRMFGSCWMPGGTTTTTSGRTRNWAGKRPPLPSPQPSIKKEPDSTSDP
jgi:transposase InsO family protein